MTTTEYVPSDEDAVDNYVAGRGGNDPGLSLPELRAEYGPEFDRFLARVRRDAAREALDGLIADKAHMTALLRAENGGEAEDVLAHFRDTLHPKETP